MQTELRDYYLTVDIRWFSRLYNEHKYEARNHYHSTYVGSLHCTITIRYESLPFNLRCVLSFLVLDCTKVTDRASLKPIGPYHSVYIVFLFVVLSSPVIVLVLPCGK